MNTTFQTDLLCGRVTVNYTADDQGTRFVIRQEGVYLPDAEGGYQPDKTDCVAILWDREGWRLVQANYPGSELHINVGDEQTDPSQLEETLEYLLKKLKKAQSV